MRKSFILIVLVVLSLSACREPKEIIREIPVEKVVTETKYDSVYIDHWNTVTLKGDTVFVYDSVDRWHFKDVFIHDSIPYVVVDSIPYNVEIEKDLSWWQGAMIRLGWIILICLILFVLYKILKEKLFMNNK